jgi:prepilin-type N-terminal cleavage/methylation domain-containing protein
MSGIRHQKSERGKPHYAQALRALYPTSDLRPLLFAERGRESFRGFTLLELLMVIGLIAILLVLIAPAFTTIKSGTEVTTAIYGVKGLLENARAYAKANHTYVFVGFAEVDSSVDPSVSPQITTGDTPYGRVAVAVVASKDGTAQYQYATTDQGNDWTANYANGAHLIAVGKLQTYENLHFVPVDFGSWSPTAHPNSKMARYQPTGPPYILGNALSSSVTPFTWPLGSPLDSGYQYRFDRVINFDPTGIARIATSTNGDAIPHVMEIDFQPSHGTVFQPLPADFNQDVGNNAVIQLGTTSGAVRVFRP